MKNILKTTGLFSIVVWMIFFIVGLVLRRPFICVISGLFCLLALVRRRRELQRENSARDLWNTFAQSSGEPKDYPYEIWKFSDDGPLRKHIIQRILDGEVYGESYSIDFFEANSQPLPRIGRYHVVCDMAGQAYCVVRTTRVTQTTYGEVTPALVKMEGCSSVGQWKRFFGAKYERLCERMDITFSTSLPLLFEEFEIVYTDKRIVDKKEGK